MKTSLIPIYSRSMKGIVLLALILLLLPYIISSSYILSVMTMIGFYTIICTGMTMLMGYAGQISLGHAAFFGIGAYASAYVTVHLHMPSFMGMIVGVLLTVIVAVLIGIPTLKLTGHFLALATLGFGMIVFTLFKQMKKITGGLDGFIGIPSFRLFSFELDSEQKYFYFIWLIALLGILLSRNMIQSRIGRAFRSIQSSEIAANSIGIDINKYKLQVFVLSGVYASVAGSIYAHYVSFINPMLFDSKTSINLLIMSVIGGGSSIWGGLIGSGTYVILGELLKEVLPMVSQISDQFEIVFFGVLLVVLLIYMPEGFAPMFEKIRRNLVRRFKMNKSSPELLGNDPLKATRRDG